MEGSDTDIDVHSPKQKSNDEIHDDNDSDNDDDDEDSDYNVDDDVDDDNDDNDDNGNGNELRPLKRITGAEIAARNISQRIFIHVHLSLCAHNNDADFHDDNEKFDTITYYVMPIVALQLPHQHHSTQKHFNAFDNNFATHCYCMYDEEKCNIAIGNNIFELFYNACKGIINKIQCQLCNSSFFVCFFFVLLIYSCFTTA